MKKCTLLLWVALMAFSAEAQSQRPVPKMVTVETMEKELRSKLSNIHDSIFSAIINRKINVYKDFTLKDTFKKRFESKPSEKTKILKLIDGFAVNYNAQGNEMSFSWLYAKSYNSDSSVITSYGELCAFDFKQLPKAISIRNIQLLLALGNMFKLEKLDPFRVNPANVVDIYNNQLYRVGQHLRSELQFSFISIKQECFDGTPFFQSRFSDSFFNIVQLSVYMIDTLDMQLSKTMKRSLLFRTIPDFYCFNSIVILPDRIGLLRSGEALSYNIAPRPKEVFISRKLLKATQLTWVDFMLSEMMN